MSSSSTNLFVTSHASSGYATAEHYSSPPNTSYGWGEPLYGDEPFPPHLTHDKFAIVNPDFWDHGVDQSVFKGWMQMIEASVSVVFPFFLLLMVILLSGCGLVLPLPLLLKWLMVGHHNDHFHLWKEVHKDIAHQLN